ncbi:XdhC family protein [Paraburkholderia caballeronis]|uniref:Xanthine dehydrogenase accessory factor n=1 Tax=Paraburkholderia caballeronis TaxID=416943 RepID=A0A1H7G659_9BURK|nr:XdhC family protein [Paraburkholderia caballeronis]PXW24753.1 xanthine dehydrogenase accessory factor [Paraburkholderia caballeronis]PXX00483.1 xanthine dehydrogenase accessory factor [Paraburkholderia caballeronis]RAJ98546.1 xanthine dehydrogenase accessory factor [Paraburkholderia caballeronis]TDV16632.1 xanthine dehydrogenase accessory factor [Paraburkholderia caballeronis]TDV19028.1 xanthine dehydrogenase accessory factor [Paraburkholderia caballeronis]
MDSVNLEVLKASIRWIDAGHRVLLVTVVKTWGSSPRPEGSMLVVRDDGVVAGSVSGGCIEDDLIDRVRRHGVVDQKPQSVRYGISADEAHRFGLPCGGTIELVLEPLADARGLAALCQRVEAGELVARTLDMTTGVALLSAARTTDGVAFDGRRFVTIHGPRYRLLVIGAGQLSRYLCQIAAGLDYQVTVCDPRDEYTDVWDVPGTRLVRTMPDDTVLDMKLDERCAVIALTHDPKLDDLALMEALKTPAFYVGALGSRRNNAARRERLKEFDLSEAELARLHGPAGIYIGSRTPPEIAVSILAEVTAAKNGVALPAMAQVAAAKAARDIGASAGALCAA